MSVQRRPHLGRELEFRVWLQGGLGSEQSPGKAAPGRGGPRPWPGASLPQGRFHAQPFLTVAPASPGPSPWTLPPALPPVTCWWLAVPGASWPPGQGLTWLPAAPLPVQLGSLICIADAPGGLLPDPEVLRAHPHPSESPSRSPAPCPLGLSVCLDKALRLSWAGKLELKRCQFPCQTPLGSENPLVSSGGPLGERQLSGALHPNREGLGSQEHPPVAVPSSALAQEQDGCPLPCALWL